MEKKMSLVNLVDQGKVRVEAYYFDVATGSFIGNGRDMNTDIVENYHLNKLLSEKEKES